MIQELLADATGRAVQQAFAGSRVMDNLRSRSPVLMREDGFRFIAIEYAVVTPHADHLVHVASTVGPTQMQDELDRVRDLLPNGLVRELDAAL